MKQKTYISIAIWKIVRLKQTKFFLTDASRFIDRSNLVHIFLLQVYHVTLGQNDVPRSKGSSKRPTRSSHVLPPIVSGHFLHPLNF